MFKMATAKKIHAYHKVLRGSFSVLFMQQDMRMHSGIGSFLFQRFLLAISAI